MLKRLRMKSVIHGLQKEGFVVLRFWNNEVLQNCHAVKEVILSTLANRAPTFILPRKGGRKWEIPELDKGKGVDDQCLEHGNEQL